MSVGNNNKRMSGWNKGRLWVMLLSSIITIIIAWIYQTDLHNFQYNSIWFWIYGVCVLVHAGAYLFCTWLDTYCSLAEINLNHVRYNEFWLLVVRWGHFMLAAVLAFFSVVYKTEFSPLVIFPLAILLFISFFHAISRTTFRLLPSYMLSFAAILLFLCMTGEGYSQNHPGNMWGVGLDSEGLAQLINVRLPKTFTNSAVLVVITPFFVALAKYLFEKYRAQTTDDTLKTTRRQLLSHWWYNPKAVLIDNACICVAICFAVACIFAVVINLPNKLDNNQKGKEPDHTRVQIQQIEGQDYNFEIDIESSPAEKDATQNEAMPFLEYFAIFASAVAFVGIVWLFEIRDNDILKSEHYYLLYLTSQVSRFNVMQENKKQWWNHLWAHLTRGIFGQISREKVIRRLHDYCQVISHLFSNVSTIRSENAAMHDVSGVLEKLSVHIEAKETKSMLASEMVYAFLDVQKRKTKESEEQNPTKEQGQSGRPAQGDLQTGAIEKRKTSEAELLFSEAVQTFIQKSCETDNACIALACINNSKKAIEDAFSQVQISWRLSDYDLSTNEFISVLQFDAMKRVAQWQIKGNCMIAWLCQKPCTTDGICGTNVNKADFLQNRRTYFLLYPLFICCSMVEHCPAFVQAADRGEPLVKEILSFYFNNISDEKIIKMINGDETAEETKLGELSKIMAGYIMGQPDAIKKSIYAGVANACPALGEFDPDSTSNLVDWGSHISNPDQDFESIQKNCFWFAAVVCGYKKKTT